MPLELGRLKSADALIAAVSTTVTLVLNFTSLTAILKFPDNVSGMSGFLSIPALISLVLLLLLFSDSIAARKKIAGLAIVACLIGGIALSYKSEYLIAANSHQIENCRDTKDTLILAPFNPSEDLQKMIEDGGGGSIKDAWCSHRDPPRFREKLLGEANSSSLQLSLMILLAQVLLTYSIIIAAWLVARKS